jgi:uncharacterized membrane protein YqaE (UPF0057 family)
MKQANLLFALVILIGSQLLYSCSSSSSFSKRKYFDFRQDKKEHARIIQEKLAVDQVTQVGDKAVNKDQTSATVQAGSLPVQPIAPAENENGKITGANAHAAPPCEKFPASNVNEKKFSLGEKTILKQAERVIKKQKEERRGDVSFLLLVILAILLPPVAVFILRDVGIELLISILLWILVILPGIIYALYIVFKDRG